jgi:hypothetical protein
LHGDRGAEGAKGPQGGVDIPRGFWRNLALSCIGASLIVSIVVSFLTRDIVEKDSREGIYQSLVEGCERRVADRVSLVNEARADVVANRIVATDPFQSKKTRDARMRQVETEQAAILDYESRLPRELRVTAEGRRLPEFLCEDQYPKP